MKRNRYYFPYAKAVLLLAGLLAGIPDHAGAETRVYAGLGFSPLIEKIESASPILYGGLPFACDLGTEIGGEGYLFEIGLRFSIGTLARCEPANALIEEWWDEETQSIVRYDRSTDSPLRIKAAVFTGCCGVVRLGGGASIRLGGRLAYRFDMSIWRDYPIFVSGLDLSPAIGLDLGGGGGLIFSAVASAPLLSLLNDPPFTGTDGWTIQHIFEDPLSVVLKHRFATIVDRPLVDLDLDLRFPLSERLSIRSAIDASLWVVEGARPWSHLSAALLLGASYTF
jgi:hypothetical protein